MQCVARILLILSLACCSVLQFVTSVLQCFTVCYSVLQCVALQHAGDTHILWYCNTCILLVLSAACCSVLQCVAEYYSVCYTCVAVYYSVLQCITVCYSVLQCVAVYYSVLQCVAVGSCCHLHDTRKNEHMSITLQHTTYR